MKQAIQSLIEGYRDAAVSLELESDQPSWETDKSNLLFGIERMANAARLIEKLTGVKVDWQSDVEYVIRHSGWMFTHGQIAYSDKLADKEYSLRVATEGMRIDHCGEQRLMQGHIVA
ncbi:MULTISPECIES: hypothetical protein [unclassified Rhizobium]|uniref:hypothetical protein n=1 Tax=unclassified Rhizobium TaxID=2613769 RepID=UPI001ADC2B79|nr:MULTISPECIES: hypothetical protein [unclassified Rhizobium]MBO9127917.1 hypothetical protein [Rhizobium sp. 16-488-2b]MBO9178494.1 hypothetical protein [Rhizobium sp. 16-488-2a]